MNKNAISRKSSIRIKKTNTGKTTCGTPAMDGYTMPAGERHAELVKNGFTVVYTKFGVIVSKG